VCVWGEKQHNFIVKIKLITGKTRKYREYILEDYILREKYDSKNQTNIRGEIIS